MAYLQVSPQGGSCDETWRGQGIRKSSVLKFSKTKSIVTVQRKFRTKYHTEPPTDKTIYEWYKIFQQSGCLCAAKRTGRPGPSAETVVRVRETFAGALRSQDIARAGNCRCLSQVSGAFRANVFARNDTGCTRS
jgi:hypothetical protein